MDKYFTSEMVGSGHPDKNMRPHRRQYTRRYFRAR